MFTTGMIVQYAGKDAPEGWLFCDGTDIPEGEQFDVLRAVLDGDKLPNYNGHVGSSQTVSESWSKGTGKTESVSHSRNVSQSKTEGYSLTRGTTQSETTGESSGANKSIGKSSGQSWSTTWSSPLPKYIIKA